MKFQELKTVAGVTSLRKTRSYPELALRIKGRYPLAFVRPVSGQQGWDLGAAGEALGYGAEFRGPQT